MRDDAASAGGLSTVLVQKETSPIEPCHAHGPISGPGNPARPVGSPFEPGPQVRGQVQ
jgi:hypothetical protein